jgi:hypothetical protein
MHTEEILSYLHAALKAGDGEGDDYDEKVEEFRNLLRGYVSELPAEQRREVVDLVIHATMDRKNNEDFCLFKDLLKEFGSELSTEQRIEAIHRTINAVINQDIFKCYSLDGVLEDFGSELPAGECREAIHRAIHVCIKQSRFNEWFMVQIRIIFPELPAEQRRETIYLAIHAAIDQKDFYFAQNLLAEFGSELLAEQRREAIHRAIHAAIDRGYGYPHGLLKDLELKLPAKEHREMVCSAIYYATEQGKFTWSSEYLKKFGSKMSTEQRTATVHITIYSAIKAGKFDISQDLLNTYGSELISKEMADTLFNIIGEADKISQALTQGHSFEDSVTKVANFMEELKKSIWLSQEKDQRQKIATAHGIKATQQAVKGKGEAPVETELLNIHVEPIDSAMNQVIDAYQAVPQAAEQDVVKEVQSRIVHIQKALADFYCTVEQAHQTLSNKHATSVHH